MWIYAAKRIRQKHIRLYNFLIDFFLYSFLQYVVAFNIASIFLSIQ